MTFQEWLDLQLFGWTVRNIARVIVFGGIALILAQKLLRKFKGQGPGTPKG